MTVINVVNFDGSDKALGYSVQGGCGGGGQSTTETDKKRPTHERDEDEKQEQKLGTHG